MILIRSASKESLSKIIHRLVKARTGEKKEVEAMYKFLGTELKNKKHWSLYLLTSHKMFEHLYGKKATKRRKLFNGSIECTYYQYWGEKIR